MRRVCCAVPVQALRSSKRLWTGVNRVLLLAQADLLGRAECLATDAFGNLLNLAAGLEERCDLIVDRFAGFNGWSWLCFAGGCFYTHGGH